MPGARLTAERRRCAFARERACPDSQILGAKEQAVQLADATHSSPHVTLDRVERLLASAPADLAGLELAGEVEATLNEGCGQVLALEAHAARASTPTELTTLLRERLGVLRARAHPAVGSPRLAGGTVAAMASNLCRGTPS